MKQTRRIQTIFVFFLLLALPGGPLQAQTKDYGAAPEIARAAKSLGKRYALVIGINDYPRARLPYAARDADEIGNMLERRYGFEVSRLTTAAETTREVIINKLWALSSQVKENDQVVVFFSGHGEAMWSKDKIAGGWLIPVNGDLQKPATLISMNTIHDLFRATPARHIVFIVDTCYSGVAGGVVTKGALSEDTAQFVERKMASPGRQLMTAGLSGQKAQMLDEYRMSLYSYFLKEGLGGNADANRDSVITMNELQAYVEPKVSRKSHGRQVPTFRSFQDYGEGEFVFVPNNTKPEDDWGQRQAELKARLEREKAAREKAEARAKDLEAKQKAADLERRIAEERRRREEVESRARELEAERQRAAAEQREAAEARRKADERAKRERLAAQANSRQSDEKHLYAAVNPLVKDARIVARDGNYVQYADGVVYDKKNGLEWFAGPDKNTNWDDAKRWAESLTSAGGGWRMPTRKELGSLYQKGAGTRNMTPLLKTTGWWIWSGEIQDSSSACLFDFLIGFEIWRSRGYSSNYPRGFAVRSR